MSQTKKSQEESEQPAKVYQLDAVNDKVDAMNTTMQQGFNRLNSSVEKLLLQNETRVTPQMLADNNNAIKKELREDVATEIKQIHAEYRPIKKNNQRLLWGIVGQAIVIVGQLIFLVILISAGR